MGGGGHGTGLLLPARLLHFTCGAPQGSCLGPPGCWRSCHKTAVLLKGRIRVNCFGIWLLWFGQNPRPEPPPPLYVQQKTTQTLTTPAALYRSQARCLDPWSKDNNLRPDAEETKEIPVDLGSHAHQRCCGGAGGRRLASRADDWCLLPSLLDLHRYRRASGPKRQTQTASGSRQSRRFRGGPGTEGRARGSSLLALLHASLALCLKP